MERLKYRTYTKLHGSAYIWRTYGQQEIDLVEDRDGVLYGYEFKWSWSSDKVVNAPYEWTQAYPDAKFEVINGNNYLSFITI